MSLPDLRMLRMKRLSKERKFSRNGWHLRIVISSLLTHFQLDLGFYLAILLHEWLSIQFPSAQAVCLRVLVLLGWNVYTGVGAFGVVVFHHVYTFNLFHSCQKVYSGLCWSGLKINRMKKKKRHSTLSI